MTRAGALGMKGGVMGLLDRINFGKKPAEPPERIDVNPAGTEIVIAWPGGVEATISAFTLRDACPCAQCIDESTGKKTLNPDTIPRDIHVESVEGVGNYAVKFNWSDGHGTGLYAWNTLRRVSGLPE
ncbi:MAG TPA: DUF971 domain-containing protein [Anaeromyxobacteraceae bacterium]|nr:DUF971 domain-containing protein [Anaeromyxobacteraceae bacterium]